MKKTKKLVLTFALFLLVTIFIFTACRNNDNGDYTLKMSGLGISGYMLSWQSVNKAESYEIEISKGSTSFDSANIDEVATTTQTSLSLAHLTLGEYVVRVRAVSTARHIVNSEWAYINYSVGSAGLTFSVSLTLFGYIASLGGADDSQPIVIPAFHNGVNVTGVAGFENSDLPEITLPSGLLHIADNTFSNCLSLTEIVIPVSVTYIGGSAFAYWTVAQTIYFDGRSEAYQNWNSAWANLTSATIVWLG